jgi:O-antigen/teichoic acid export membrane protein
LPRERYVRSGILLAISYALSAAASFLVNILLGRRLGAAALGTFALATSVARIFYSGTDLGVAPHVTREVARTPERTQEIGSLFVTFRSILIPIALVIAIATSFAIGDRQVAIFALVLSGQGFVAIGVVYEALAQAHRRQPSAAAIAVIAAALLVGSTTLWYFAHAQLLAFSVAYGAALFGGCAVWVYWAFTRLEFAPHFRYDRRTLLGHFSRSWPIGLSFLLSNAALRAPVLVLGSFGSKGDVGAFAAVDMFVTAAAIVQSALTNATFPLLAESYRTDARTFRRVFWMSNLLLAAGGLVIGAFLVYAGPPLLAVLFPGKDFARIATIMPIVGWSTPLLLIVHHNIFIFAAADNERLNLRFMMIWCALIGTAELVLVPEYGLTGAAWGVLIGRVAGTLVLVATLVAAGIHRGAEPEGTISRGRLPGLARNAPP